MFRKVRRGGVVFYVSTMLENVTHGFSTRIGGISEGELSSLNLGYGRGDGDETVNHNRRLFAAACGIGDGDTVEGRVFVSAEQIHSARIEYVTPSNKAGDFVCDGLVTDIPRIPIAVKTADCVPILLYEGGAGVAAAVHAGWRGTASGIAGAAVQRMCDLGANRDRIRAAIGPCICADCFEVGDDFPDAFRALADESPSMRVRAAADAIVDEFIVRRDDGRLHCDLATINERILLLSGVRARNIDKAALCTKESACRFYSHRRSGPARGVMASVIMV